MCRIASWVINNKTTAIQPVLPYPTPHVRGINSSLNGVNLRDLTSIAGSPNECTLGAGFSDWTFMR
jgi:hypothetical protein